MAVKMGIECLVNMLCDYFMFSERYLFQQILTSIFAVKSLCFCVNVVDAKKDNTFMLCE